MVDVNVSPQEIAKAMKLRYVSSDKKGYSRQKKGKGFIYLDTKEEEIKDPEILDHIKGLVIPPAWTDVWISPYPNGHLQATGYDVKGRKQYRYHSRWSKVRNDNKFGQITWYIHGIKRYGRYRLRYPYFRPDVKVCRNCRGSFNRSECN